MTIIPVCDNKYNTTICILLLLISSFFKNFLKVGDYDTDSLGIVHHAAKKGGTDMLKWFFDAGTLKTLLLTIFFSSFLFLDINKYDLIRPNTTFIK